MKTFIFLLIFSMLSAGIMLSGISMKNSTQSGAIMLVLGVAFLGYIWKSTKRSRHRL